MTTIPDPSGWRHLGDTANTRNYEAEPGVLAVIPHPRSRDDGATARENVELQLRHLAAWGGGVTVIFFDNLVAQDKEARRVYQTIPDPAVMRGTALVGGTMLARAIGSFFLGLSRPRVPLKMFGELAPALAWAREINRAAAAAAAGAPPS